MKKYYAFAALLCAAQMTFAATAQPDSLQVEELNEVTVMGVKAPKNAPFAVAKIDRKELESFSKTGQELPFLFARTPGVLAWSENGLGTGTTYMRIRGAADSRINITLDGVSLNSPEDQCVFWANMNSYSALLSSVQIQRGVGTSTNGDGAFGGSVALQSKAANTLPELELTASYGSYNTYNAGLNFSTGLLGDHWIIDGAYHHTGTDGYIHGTGGNSGSYYAGLTYLSTDGRLRLSYKNIGNYEKTGQAWNGIDTGELMDWNYGGMGTGITSYKDMYKAGLGRFNTLYEYMNDPYDPSAGTSRYQMADGSYWKQTTDNFWQDHNLLSMAYKINDHWRLNATLHYTHGDGFYEEFRYDNKLKKFGLSNFTLSDGNTLKKTDFIRKKGLGQDAYGMVWNANYQDKHWDVMGGASFQNFQGTHYGYLTYIANPELANAIMTDGRYQYYDSNADKADISLYLKGTYHITGNFDAFADLQYRNVSFSTLGYNDKFVDNGDGTYSNQLLNIHKNYDFLNPKVGLSYHKDGHNAYASYALSHREPERNNFTDNGAYPAPKAEVLNDIELGYQYQSARWHAGANLYAMLYHNQFVQTGELSDIGEALTTNIKESYRMGVELTAGVNVTKWFALEANAAISQNKNKDFTEYVEDWDWATGEEFVQNHYDNSTLAFSPTAILNGFADFHVGGFNATWHTNFVSKQFLDNTACDQRSLPSYTQTDIMLGYDLKLKKRTDLKNIHFGLNLNNIFNSHHARAGWVYSALYASGGNPEGNRYTEIGYIPMAGFNVMGNISLRF